ncbi:MAG: single-stranded DNA-binding protein [Bacilli bacterium]|nr:single-stranded DNA-binding protein [Bacilli bacterium]
MLNRVILIGNLTREPETRKPSPELTITNFTIAVNDYKKNSDGTSNPPLYMRCVTFGQKAELARASLHKGTRVAVEGRLSQRKYIRQTDGIEMTTIETIIDNFYFLDPKDTTPRANEGGNDFRPDRPAPGVTSQVQPESSSNMDTIDTLDDDLPDFE